MRLAHDSWFTFDKLQHAGRGMLIYSVTHITFPDVWNWAPLAVAVVFAIGYEFYDTWRHAHFSWRDAVCDTLGAALVFGLWTWRM